MLTYIEIDPVAFQVMGVDVHWYGLMYLIAIALAWLLGIYRARLDWRPVRARQIEDLVFYGTIGAIVGARIGFIWFYPQHEIMQEPFWVFKVWEGGMSFHGGLLGVMLAMIFYSQKIKQPYFRLLDFVAPLIPLGLLVGNLGNYIGQELWGRESDGPLSVVFPADPEGLSRHPSQLYQAFLEGILLFVILAIYARKPRPTGAVCAVFAIFYGCFRIVAELYREPDAHIQYDLWGWVTRGQLLSVPLVVLGCLLLLVTYVYSIKQRRKSQRLSQSQVSDETSAVKEGLSMTKEEPSAAKRAPSAEKGPSATEQEPSATEHEPSAVGREPSAAGREPSAAKREPAPTEKEPSATEQEPSSIKAKPSAVQTMSADVETVPLPSDAQILEQVKSSTSPELGDSVVSLTSTERASELALAPNEESAAKEAAAENNLAKVKANPLVDQSESIALSEDSVSKPIK